MVTEGRIPHKRELVGRVNSLYQALKDRDRDTFLTLVHPQDLGCLKKSSPALFEPWTSTSRPMIGAWEVRSIQARPNLKQQPLDNCDGEPLRGDATVLVFVAQSDGPSAKGGAASDVHVRFWVHVEGVWYWIASDGS